MRLFHVSEKENIPVFHPRKPSRKDLDQETGLVWAINEACLPNFLTPRDCPRVCYHAGESTTMEDQQKHFTSSTIKHTVIIESKWFNTLQKTTLYVYEFNPTNFELLDPIAGYYVSKHSEIPISKHTINNILEELFARNIELRIVDNLHDIANIIRKTSLHWSLCRMANAQDRKVYK